MRRKHQRHGPKDSMSTYDKPDAGDILVNLVAPETKEEPFVVATEETPLAKVVPVEATALGDGRLIGFMKGEALIPDDFDRMGEDEILALFEGQD